MDRKNDKKFDKHLVSIILIQLVVISLMMMAYFVIETLNYNIINQIIIMLFFGGIFVLQIVSIRLIRLRKETKQVYKEHYKLEFILFVFLILIASLGLISVIINVFKSASSPNLMLIILVIDYILCLKMRKNFGIKSE